MAGLFCPKIAPRDKKEENIVSELNINHANNNAARPLKGISIERVYTTKGVHPYDQIEWVRRDVVQTNWKTGEVVFEQRGVEFPSFWSMNAVTIVTTKYFRGALGSPDREHSLKQLIDRVVNTYVQSGIDNDYFTTPDDAAVFSDELRWMLVNQIFSFNSPVWFNVGTSSAPQISACFILAVDDTMDSILDWYKEEGLIFKGGSGAGLNLSRIRSSKELLKSSGGTASGPVSFMRGADASAGTIKSGGATRRAAKMVVLDVDHPDIEEFIETKAREEKKIKALRDAGFEMDLGGKDIISVQYQNANNSVRVSDMFMKAVENGEPFGLTARTTGEVIETVDARTLFRKIAQAAWECADPGMQYDDTINDWHTNKNTGRITASNPCSEYLSLDNSSCNLASLNLMKFLKDDNTFDAELFRKTVEIVITAMDISICFGHFPTEKIAQTTRDYRQLGIGYANLGALLMSCGLPYDSEEGRSLSAAITALMTATAYRRSAELAGAIAPYNGYIINSEPHTRVMEKHAAAMDKLVTFNNVDGELAKLASEEFARNLELGKINGWRNAQVSLLAPTGCLVEGTLVTTDFGLMRMEEIGDLYGDQWQDISMQVSTDEGPQTATKFFVNGEEPTRRIVTKAGYEIQGTLLHRVKVVNPATGEWEWKRLADIAEGDVLPLQLGTMVGEPREIALPLLGENSPTPRPSTVFVPRSMNAELAELVGYFMGDGSLHAKGLRFCVANTDPDVAERLSVLSQSLFNITPVVYEKEGYKSVEINSTQLVEWWDAAGFAKKNPFYGHVGKGWTPHVPTLVRATNNPVIYQAFLRGVMEADASVNDGVPSVSTASKTFGQDLQTLALTLGFPMTLRVMTNGLGQNPQYVLRLRNIEYVPMFRESVGFMSVRKTQLLRVDETSIVGKNDRVFLPVEAWKELVPVGHELRGRTISSLGKHNAVSRSLALEIHAETQDEVLENALGYVYEIVAGNEDGGVQPTFDLSVPENVTYVANGFVSHNTISFMMDSDTTGVEPDFSLVKFKKLVDGGSLQIVNAQVPRALRTLGYEETTIEAIEAHIMEHGNVVDAPGLKPEHYEVFDCAVGDRAITPEGHIHMMAAIQPFVSGAISKTVNLPESATVEDIERVYFESWKLGLKAVAVYRDNCKVGQPLSDGKAKKSSTEQDIPVKVEKEIVYVEVPTRTKLPRTRKGETVSFEVQGNEGYLSTGEYADGRLGEVFVKMSKQGSTLAGLIDAFSIAVSIGLQYGVPLDTFVEKFIGTRFEPAGITDDPDIRMAQSVVDYIFRRLALDYMDAETRAAYGILTASERIASLDASHGAIPEAIVIEEEEIESIKMEELVKNKKDDSPASAEESSQTVPHVSALESHKIKIEAPMCPSCGHNKGMRPSGSCWACECGTTTGCS